MHPKTFHALSKSPGFMLCAMLCLSSCLSPERRTIREFDAIARRGQSEEAEARYLSYLAQQPLDDAQWTHAAQALCNVRTQRITQRLEETQDGGHALTRQELHTLTQQSLSCAAFNTQHRMLFERMIERTQLDIEHDLKPLVQQDAYGAILSRAHHYTPYLPIDHPYAIWFTQIQSRAASHYTDLRDTHFGEQLTLTAQFLDLLKNHAESMHSEALDEAAHHTLRKANNLFVYEEIRPYFAPLDVLPNHPQCLPFLMPPLVGEDVMNHPLALPVHASITITDCEVTLDTNATKDGRHHHTLALRHTAQLHMTFQGSDAHTIDRHTCAHTYEGDLAEPLNTQDTYELLVPGSHLASPGQYLDHMAHQHLFARPAHTSLLQALRHALHQTKEPARQHELLLAILFLQESSDSPETRLTPHEHQRLQATFGADTSRYPRALFPRHAWYDADDYPRLPRK